MASEKTAKDYGMTVLRVLALLSCLYLFLFGLALMGDSFKVLGGKAAGTLFTSISNPIAGLMVGILATVLVQSSSTSTSIVVGLVGSGVMAVQTAIPIIMGANIGTSVTNTIVSMGHINNVEEFRLAFAGATVHDMFNMLTVATLLPVEVITNAMTGGKGGILFGITAAITNGLAGAAGGKFTSPVKVLVSPLVKALLSVDKDKIAALSLGAPTNSSCLTTVSKGKVVAKVVAKVNYQVCGNATLLSAATKAYDKVLSSSLIKKGALKGSGDGFAGTLCLVLSLVVLCGALFAIVKLLHRMVMGEAQRVIQRALDLNGYLAICVGALLTVLVQSSSIITSTLTPLVGVGVLSLDKMLPLTLGANIGTTVTALLASLVVGSASALQIALCHLFFNILGIAIWYPVPAMRAVPLRMARWMGEVTVLFRFFPAVYILVMFVLVPVMLLGLSSLYVAGGGLTVLGVLLTLLLLGVGGYTWFFFKRKDGADKLAAFLARTFGTTNGDKVHAPKDGGDVEMAAGGSTTPANASSHSAENSEEAEEASAKVEEVAPAAATTVESTQA